MWLIYALGGGWGHLTRAVALARAAQRDRPVRILANSPYIAHVTDGVDIVCCETRDSALRAIHDTAPDCLIVDTFPRGIGGELCALRSDARKVLVHRDLNPEYVQQFDLAQFVSSNYDLVVVPGATEGSQFRSDIRTAPWLVRSAHEIPTDVPVKPGTVLVCASGRAEELAWYGAVIAELSRLDCPAPVRCVSADRPLQCPEDLWLRYWPAIDLLGAASVVIGGAGYNTISECVSWQAPLVARPWPRMYDRQELRARRAAELGRVIVVDTPEEAARAAIREAGEQTARTPNFVNGAEEAVTRIESLRP
ncbi:MAG TPA: hypothetical protein VKU19_33170 [Bryobacteraceae bacterium]|nr:hypothetical protein [Bryobacteraceae bacterium]